MSSASSCHQKVRQLAEQSESLSSCLSSVRPSGKTIISSQPSLPASGSSIHDRTHTVLPLLLLQFEVPSFDMQFPEQRSLQQEMVARHGKQQEQDESSGGEGDVCSIGRKRIRGKTDPDHRRGRESRIH